MAWWDDLASGAQEASDETLKPLGLDPNQWDLAYHPQTPQQIPITQAYHPGFRGMLERYGPILAAGAQPLLLGQRPEYASPLARSLALMAHAGSEYLQTGVDQRARTIEDTNAARRQVTQDANEAERQRVQGNRDLYRKTLIERTTPRQIVEQAAADKATQAGQVAGAEQSARIKAYKDAGLNPPGTPPKAKPAKPVKPGREPSIGAFRLFGPGDEIAVKQLQDELNTMRSNYMTKSAFEPPRRDGKGRAMPESPTIAQARQRITTINRQVHDATKTALLGRLDELSYDVEASPKAARKRLAEIHNAAVASGLDKDPEYGAAAEARAQEILDAMKGQ